MQKVLKRAFVCPLFLRCMIWVADSPWRIWQRCRCVWRGLLMPRGPGHWGCHLGRAGGPAPTQQNVWYTYRNLSLVVVNLFQETVSKCLFCHCIRSKMAHVFEILPRERQGSLYNAIKYQYCRFAVGASSRGVDYFPETDSPVWAPVGLIKEVHIVPHEPFSIYHVKAICPGKHICNSNTV